MRRRCDGATPAAAAVRALTAHRTASARSAAHANAAQREARAVRLSGERRHIDGSAGRQPLADGCLLRFDRRVRRLCAPDELPTCALGGSAAGAGRDGCVVNDCVLCAGAYAFRCSQSICGCGSSLFSLSTALRQRHRHREPRLAEREWSRRLLAASGAAHWPSLAAGWRVSILSAGAAYCWAEHSKEDWTGARTVALVRPEKWRLAETTNAKKEASIRDARCACRTPTHASSRANARSHAGT
jgi:hypothetical protein